MKADRLIFIAALALVVYYFVRKNRQLANSIAALQAAGTGKTETLVTNQYVTPQYITQNVTPTNPNPIDVVKFVNVNVPVDGIFDDYLTQQTTESDEMQDTRIVQFLFESDNLANYWFMHGYDANMIAQFL